MPNTRSRVSVHRSSGPKRATTWAAGADVVGVIALAANTKALIQSLTATVIGAVAPAGGTIVRTRGTLWVASDQATAPEEPIGALGMMVVTDTARAVGVTAVPTPVTDSFDDRFFLWQSWQAGIMFVQQDATGVQIWNGWTRYDFDSKAQRKFTNTDAIVVTMENSHASDAVEFQLQFRMLLKPGVSQ